jgi:phage-related holin
MSTQDAIADAIARIFLKRSWAGEVRNVSVMVAIGVSGRIASVLRDSGHIADIGAGAVDSVHLTVAVEGIGPVGQRSVSRWYQ